VGGPSVCLLAVVCFALTFLSRFRRCFVAPLSACTRARARARAGLRKLEDKGIGELSFDEVYRALLLGAVPPALVTDAVRLLAAGRPGEGGGAPFLSGEAAQAYYGREGAGDVSVAALVFSLLPAFF